jgi:hypothetical protein
MADDAFNLDTIQRLHELHPKDWLQKAAEMALDQGMNRQEFMRLIDGYAPNAIVAEACLAHFNTQLHRDNQ